MAYASKCVRIIKSAKVGDDRVARYNIENDVVVISLERFMRIPPELIYQAWTDADIMRRWFMTSNRSNQSIDLIPEEGRRYEIIDERNGKKNRVTGVFQELEAPNRIVMTIGMPELSDKEDTIEVEIFEREPGSDMTQMNFRYTAVVPKERRWTTLEYKQQKKEYHDATAHGFENMFIKLQDILREMQEDKEEF